MTDAVLTRVLTALCLAAALGCSTAGEAVNIESHAFALAEANRARVNKVRLGQTLIEVEKILGPPERRAARLRYDGVSVSWQLSQRS